MGTLVCFHAHPDDEAIATGGSMARAVAEGHRVVLVVATNGDFGEVPDDLADGETLADRRRAETMRSAEVLGIHRVVWLGYADSGMTGWGQNHGPNSFHAADLDEAAERFAQVLRDESADVLTTYDWHGGYGHPDHIKVHHVGHRAAEIASTPTVFEASMNRDAIVQGRARRGVKVIGFVLDLALESNDLPPSLLDPLLVRVRGWGRLRLLVGFGHFRRKVGSGRRSDNQRPDGRLSRWSMG